MRKTIKDKETQILHNPSERSHQFQLYCSQVEWAKENRQRTKNVAFQMKYRTTSLKGYSTMDESCTAMTGKNQSFTLDIYHL